jgi:plastocyanin
MHTMLRSITRSALPVLLAAAAGACGGDGGQGLGGGQLTTFNVTPTSATLFTVAPGKTVTLATVATDQDGAIMTGTPVFASGDAAVATVDASGLVTAVGVGSTGITSSLTLGGITKSATTTITVVAAGATATVTAPQLLFTPATVDVQAGGAVTWTIETVHHNVTFSTAGAPADVPELLNASASRTFPTSGTYPYRCTIHPVMTGTVRVH